MYRNLILDKPGTGQVRGFSSLHGNRIVALLGRDQFMGEARWYVPPAGSWDCFGIVGSLIQQVFSLPPVGGWPVRVGRRDSHIKQYPRGQVGGINRKESR